MSDKKIILNPQTESVEIEISRKKSERDIFVRENAKGIIAPRRSLPYLARRLQKSAYWKFFDLGQIAVEDYFDDLNFEADANNVFNSASGVTTDDLQLADLQAKANYYLSEMAVWRTEAEAISGTTEPQVLSYIEAKLKEKYLQLKKVSADVFLITVSLPFTPGNLPLDSNSPRWTNDQIKIEDTENPDYLILRGNPLFYQTYIDCRPAYRSYGEKVTDAPSFTADEDLTFTLKRDAEFYLAPAFCSIYFAATGEVNPPNDRPEFDYRENGNLFPYGYVQELHFNYHTYPRNDLIEWLVLWRSFNFLMVKENGAYTLASYQLFYYVSQAVLELYPEAINYSQLQGRTAEYDQNGSNYLTLHETNHWTFPNPNAFPAPPGLPDDDISYGEPSQYRAYWNAYSGSGDLLLIIFQDKQFYYVWRR